MNRFLQAVREIFNYPGANLKNLFRKVTKRSEQKMLWRADYIRLGFELHRKLITFKLLRKLVHFKMGTSLYTGHKLENHRIRPVMSDE